MATYKFVGDETMEFPSLLTANGEVVVLSPGDEVELEVEPVSGFLVPSKKSSKQATAPADEAAADK